MNKVLRYFYQLDHAGELFGSEVYVAEEGSEEQGDVVRLYIKCQDDTIITARFKSHGSVALIAASEYLCQLLQGQSLHFAQQINPQIISQGLELSQLKISAAVLPSKCLHHVLKKIVAARKF